MDFSPGIPYFLGQLHKAFFAPGSHVSLLSLLCALLIAVFFVAARRMRKGRRLRLRTLLRALFPKHIVMSRSTVADLGYFYFNLFPVRHHLRLGAAVVRGSKPRRRQIS